MKDDGQLLVVLSVMSFLIVDMLIMENGSIIFRAFMGIVELVQRIG